MEDDTEHDARRAATEALARAWNRLDPGVVAPFLSEDVSYESVETELHLVGKRQVMANLERKAELITAAGEGAEVWAEVGSLPAPADQRYPCVISRQGGGGRTALFLLRFTTDGLIERVEVVTSDPDAAVGSGDFPS